jgi:hypothetical protein
MLNGEMKKIRPLGVFVPSTDQLIYGHKFVFNTDASWYEATINEAEANNLIELGWCVAVSDDSIDESLQDLDNFPQDSDLIESDDNEEL